MVNRPNKSIILHRIIETNRPIPMNNERLDKNMRLKKIFSILFVMTLVLSFSQSAFAYKDYADSMQTAEELDIDGYTTVTNLDYADVDFYKVVNTTRSSIKFRIELSNNLRDFGQIPNINFDMLLLNPNSNGDRQVLAPRDRGIAGLDFQEFTVPAGETTYIMVYGHSADDFGDEDYKLVLRKYN